MGGGGGKYAQSANKNFDPPLKSFQGGGQNLNRKFKTFDFLDTLQPKDHTRTMLSLNQTKQAEKNSKLMVLILFTLKF